HAAVGGRDADRAALVAADGHVDLARRHHGRAARRGAARRVAGPARVLHGAGRAGGAAAREAEVLAVHLAGDGAARVEDAGDDGGVDVGDVALQRGRAVHHGDAGQADVVLQRDPLAPELARRRPLHLALVVPGVVLVLRAFRPMAGRARVLHGR